MATCTQTIAAPTPSSEQQRHLLEKAGVLESSAHAFDLAAAIIRRQYHCENSWCRGQTETFDEPPGDGIDLESNLIRSVAARMRGGPNTARDAAFDRLSRALDDADRDFVTRFHSEDRLQLIERLERICWDCPEAGPRGFMLQDSPFARPAYKRFLTAAWRLVGSYPVTVQVCFKLGLCAVAEQYRLLSDLIADAKRMSPARALQERIAPAVRALLTELNAFEQLLPMDAVDIGYEVRHSIGSSSPYEHWARDRLEKVATTLPDRVRRAAARLRESAAKLRDTAIEPPCLPCWQRDIAELSFRGVTFRYNRPAPRQRPLLDRFQENQWCEFAKNPFVDPDGKPSYPKLKNAVDDLHKKCKDANLPLKFSIAGSESEFAQWHDSSQDPKVREEVPGANLENP